VLYTENHVGSLATLSPEELARVVAVWRDRTTELWADPHHAFVMAFENRGEAVGATISHPHGQIYAFDRLPPFIAGRVSAIANPPADREGACVVCDVVGRELSGPRVLEANTSFAVSVPFAARWPYEVHVRARRHGLRRLGDLEPSEQVDLARALHDVVSRYDVLFGGGVPYMMVILEGPQESPDWHLAVEFLPPHRTERLLKVRASVETATGLFINDTLPEESAARLRAIRVGRRAEAAAPIVEIRSP
jgi:UDPglucose--hexose-1-phosphate uridylyltransferase